MAGVGRWALGAVWTLIWFVLFFLCLGVLGDRAAYVGIPALILAQLAVWYATERRQEGPDERR